MDVTSSYLTVGVLFLCVVFFYRTNGTPRLDGTTGHSGDKGDKGDKGARSKKGDKRVDDKLVLEKLVADMSLLQKEIATLAKENKDLKSKFSLLDGNNKIKQSYLPAGYDKYSLYDIQWQSLHMAAAAACRGSTPTGGSGYLANYVYAKKDGVSCTATCWQTTYKNCDAAISIHGYVGKSTKVLQPVGAYYNYGCGMSRLWYSKGIEEKIKNEQISSVVYISYCCCRK